MRLLILVILFPSCFAWDLWRDYYMPIAAAAYSDNPNQCLSKVQTSNNTFSMYRQYTIACDSLNSTCSGYIAIDNLTVPPTIYIAFRGSNNNYQIFENGWNWNEMVPFVGGGKVGKIYFDGFNDLWNAGMKDDLLTLKNKYSDAIMSFIGHSLGGAMASIAAATTFSTRIGDSVFLDTFGQPRVGDKDFANAVRKMGISSTRIIHKADIVPHLPPLNQSGYYHFAEEEWFNNDMENSKDFTICSGDNGEDLKCSNSLNDSDYNIEDHKYYYGQNFIEYGKSGCPD